MIDYSPVDKNSCSAKGGLAWAGHVVCAVGEKVFDFEWVIRV